MKVWKFTEVYGTVMISQENEMICIDFHHYVSPQNFFLEH